MQTAANIMYAAIIGRDGRMYSRADAKDRMMEQMEEMMGSASNDRERDIIRRCMDQLEKA